MFGKNVCNAFLRGARPKAADKGLWAGRVIGSGHNVSFSERKTLRKWYPNTQWVSLYSEIMKKKLSFKVTTHALRIIDKVGGIDNYLLQTPSKKLDSKIGTKMKKVLVNEVFKQRRERAYKHAVEQTAQQIAQYIINEAPELMQWTPDMLPKDE